MYLSPIAYKSVIIKYTKNWKAIMRTGSRLFVGFKRLNQYGDLVFTLFRGVVAWWLILEPRNEKTRFLPV